MTATILEKPDNRSAPRDQLAAIKTAAEVLLQKATTEVRAQMRQKEFAEREQTTLHGLAWLATYVEALRQTLAWLDRLETENRCSDFERLIATAAFGEYAAQLVGGIPMSQGETIRLSAFGITRSDIGKFEDIAATVIDLGTSEGLRSNLARQIAAQPNATTFGETGLDETLSEMREQMRRFGEAEVLPHAHGWHLSNHYIPFEIIDKLNDLGVFGLTIPEEFDGLGLGKESMCVVSEELYWRRFTRHPF
jgi:(2S)-methylsuccinyl-CoA dehydrogenase